MKSEKSILLKKLLILYIYLKKEICYLIKTGKIHSAIASNEQIAKRKVQKNWFSKLALRALLLSFLVFFTIVYLHQGSLIFNSDGSLIFNRMAVFEFSVTFVFLLGVFVSHRGISWLINKSSLTSFNKVVKKGVEALLVILSSVLCLFLFVLLPFYLIFPEIEVQPDRIRFNYIFMALLTLFFYYFVERERGKKQLQAEMLRAESLQKENFKAQLKSLKDQVSPHFLFNSLNVLSSLIQQDREKATEFTERLSDLYRSFLENSHLQLISLEKELEVVEAYIYLLKTRFGEAVRFEVDIEQEKKKLLLPPASLQMLIENAIKHNGSTRKRPLIISIRSGENYVSVHNNLQPRNEEMKSTRTGLENIKTRYRFLSDEEVEITETKSDFTVKLPLLKVENENSHYRR